MKTNLKQIVNPLMTPFTSTLVIIFMGICLVFTACKKEIRNNDLEAEEQSKSAHLPPQMKQVALEMITDNLVSPIGLVPVPDNTGRLFIIDQVGKAWIIEGDGDKLATPFIDLASRMVTLNAGFDERGFLGLAFHPQYAENGRFFVYYNAPPRAGGPPEGGSWNNLSRISEFRVSGGDANLADMSSERILLELDDPQSNHNGGTLVFGPDGYLYISIGDGGGANDTNNGHVDDWYLANDGGNGQDVEANLFGNILRIDINSGNPYGIPSDNPFVNKTGLDEIYAYGFRNPYRMSFDMSGSRELYVGDAGQLLYEEIDVVKKGGNYGWNVKEGTTCFNAASSLTPFTSCPSVDPLGNVLIDPVIEMLNTANPATGPKAITIIGGHVYRGNTLAGYQGRYIFAGFSKTFSPSGELFVANPGGPGLWPFQEISVKDHADHLGMFLKGFGQDLNGEIYINTSTVLGPTGTSGKVFKLVMSE